MQNPLFPTDQSTQNLQPVQAPQVITPLQPTRTQPAAAVEGRDAATELIRRKVAAAYAAEPNAKAEIAEITQLTSHNQPITKHQAYMQQLNQSGKSMVEIQHAWHSYYTGLPDQEKHEVWQEFYAAQPGGTPMQKQVSLLDQAKAAGKPAPAVHKPAVKDLRSLGAQFKRARLPDARSVADIKKKIHHTVSAGGTLKTKHHLQSLGFGLAAGLVVVFISLFTFFNEIIIGPFIQPSRLASETPVIVDPTSAVVGGAPKVIVPKINVEIPVDYTQKTTDDKAIETALDNGVVHYPTTVKPGEVGNAAYFGHSSNNIFNPGKYKFAFVLLHKLENGDTFYLTNDSKVYAYRVISKRIVPPSEVSVLNPVAGYASTATLITCDPPGTSLNRLVVVGEQISPTPGASPAPTTPAEPAAPILSASETSLPGNGPTLWSRMWGSIF